MVFHLPGAWLLHGIVLLYFSGHSVCLPAGLSVCLSVCVSLCLSLLLSRVLIS